MLLFQLLTTSGLSQVISGRITNRENNPLPFANIFCPELNIGTTSNLDGEFVFKLTTGSRTIIFSYVGYKSDTLLVDIKAGEKRSIDIILYEKAAEIQTVYVLDTGLSVAERIVLRTIASKNDYLDKIKNYRYRAYDKTVLSVTHKDTLMISGVMESFTKAYYEQPDKFNEVVLSKRQTKNLMSEYTNLFTSGKLPNLLDNEIRIDEAYIISPLNNNALDYYSYQVEDTTYYGNHRVFIMDFEPKNKVIPLFSGKFGIMDSLYLPIFFSLNGGTNILTAVKKNIEIDEKFAEFENDLWMPILVNEKYTFNMSFPGIPPIYGDHTTLLSEYKINDPDFNHDFTKYIQTEKLVSENEAAELWNYNQQIVLTQREIKGAAKVDSIMENMSFIPKSIFWLMQRGFAGFPNLPITSFNDFYHFNRTEGHYAGVGLEFNDILSGTNLSIVTGYGFSDKKTKYDFKLEHKYKWISGYAEIYNRLNKLDRFYNYSDFDITFQSWFSKDDYADYYYSKGIAAGLGFQVHENILLGLDIQNRKDKNAFLNSDWSLLNRKASYRPAVKIDEGNITELSFNLNYDNKNYYDLGFVRLPDQTKNYLDLNLKITRGYYSSSSSGYYWQFYLAFNGRNKLSSWIDPSYSFKGVLNDGLILRQNLYHLRGNYGTIPTKFLFNTLRNDEYIGDKFASIILENNFGNVIYKLLGIPYMKDNKYDLIIFGKYGWINEDPLVHKSRSIYETGIAIGNIMSFLRIDFALRLQPHSKGKFFVNLVSMYDM